MAQRFRSFLNEGHFMRNVVGSWWPNKKIHETKLESIFHLMQQCYWQGSERIIDDVFEMCGGNAR
eukprot:12914063-Prorocentrum_lima.AAC.1